MLVDIHSATHGCKEHAQYPINRNHSELVKFSSPYDEDYQRILSVLRKAKGESSTPPRAEPCGPTAAPFVELSRPLPPLLDCSPSYSFSASTETSRNVHQERTDIGRASSAEIPLGPGKDDPLARIPSLSKVAYRAYSFFSNWPGDSANKLAGVAHSLSCALNHAEKHVSAIGKVQSEDSAITSQISQLRDLISQCEQRLHILSLIVKEIEARGVEASHTTPIDPDSHERLEYLSNALSAVLASQIWYDSHG